MKSPRAAVAATLILGSFFAPLAAQSQQAGGGPPDEVTFESGKLTLRGFIHKPDGPGPFPVVLWNHGSEQRPGWLPALAPMFTTGGYVFFVPHRRGQGRSAGPYILDVLRQEMEQRGQDAWSRRLVSMQEEHLQDQLAALAFVRALSYVDGSRVAIMGCSFGGIQTILAAEQEHSTRVAIAFAPAAQTWKHSYALRERLRKAVRHAAIPVMFVQAQNDYDLEPSRVLAKEAEKAGKPAKLLVFPAFGTSAQDGHEFCVRGAHIWSRDVFAFLRASIGP